MNCRKSDGTSWLFWFEVQCFEEERNEVCFRLLFFTQSLREMACETINLVGATSLFLRNRD